MQLLRLLTGLLAVLGLAACASSPVPLGRTDLMTLHDEVQQATYDLTTQVPASAGLFKSAYAYAVFPDVCGGGLGIGGAYGNGEVYQGGKRIGYADLSQGTVGAEIGGQSFAEVVFFQNAAALDEFKAGLWSADARATVVAEAGGAGTAADYQHGAAVYVLPQFGLMAQASVGAQRFRFVPQP